MSYRIPQFHLNFIVVTPVTLATPPLRHAVRLQQGDQQRKAENTTVDFGWSKRRYASQSISTPLHPYET
ncbi:hypothetical protein L1887_07345 [Cichorium endivia]|nr:hypothetical protein L1887_07345 [Cichorium endivia]